MNNVKNVIRKKCVGCGCCIGICKQKALEKEFDKKTGFYNIVLNRERCNECGLCRRVCPALKRSSKPDYIGPYEELLLMHSNDSGIRKKATSGGVVFSVVKKALEEQVVDYAYILGWSSESVMQTKLWLLDKETIKDVDDNRKFSSRYLSYPIGEVISEIKPDKKYVIVGLPCQIEGFRNSNLDNVFLIGIACSGAVSYKASEMAQKHLKKSFDSKNDSYFYRGDGWPGFNEVISDESNYREEHLTSFFNSIFSSKVFTKKGCMNCNDQLAEMADISCFDYWNQTELKNEKIGKTGVIIRSEKGLQLMDSVGEVVSTDASLEKDEIIKTQIIPITYKKKVVNKKPLIIKLYYSFARFVFRLGIYKCFSKKTYKKMTKIYNRAVLKYK